MFRTKVVDKIKTHFVLSKLSSENRAVYKKMWISNVDRGRPQMTIWRMCIAWWLPKARNTHTHTQAVQYSLLFHSNNGCTNAPPCCVIRTLPVLIFHGSTALVDLSLLIVMASSSHAGVDYTWLLYTLVTSEFITAFKFASSNDESDSVRWRLNPNEWSWSLFIFTRMYTRSVSSIQPVCALL